MGHGRFLRCDLSTFSFLQSSRQPFVSCLLLSPSPRRFCCIASTSGRYWGFRLHIVDVSSILRRDKLPLEDHFRCNGHNSRRRFLWTMLLLLMLLLLLMVLLLLMLALLLLPQLL